jgi:tetratricopeptide (TPR) repeat protein
VLRLRFGAYNLGMRPVVNFIARGWRSPISNGGLPAALFGVFLLFCPNHLAAQSAGPAGGAVRTHLTAGETALKARDPETAAKEFRAVLALDPKNAQAHTSLGVISFLQGDYQTASANLRSALAVQPSLIKAQALLGICEKRLGDPGARGLLEKTFPKLQEKPLRMQVGVELAGLYDQQGELAATAAVMRSLVELDPDNVDVLFMAQRVYSELAEETLNKLAVIAPGSARMQQVIAERLINEGDVQGAIVHYRNALEIDPRLPGVHYELAEAILEDALSDAQAQAEAEKEVQAAARMEGDTAKVECLLGRIALLHSDQYQAFADYSRAYALDSADVEAQIGLAKTLVIMEKPEEALKYLRIAVQADPLNAEAHYRLAAVCRKLGRTEEAAKELHLFQEIKQTKNRVRELYKQMNRKPREQDDQTPDAPQ